MGTLLRSIPGLVVLLFSVTGTFQISAQTLQDGVDLVTMGSNDLLPTLLGSLSVKNENVVIGPYGVFSIVGMALEASNGTTRQEILSSIGMAEEDVTTMRVGFKAYCDLFLEHSLNPEAAGAFNSITLESGFHLGSNVKNILANYYCANISETANAIPSLKLESHAGVMAHWKHYEKLAVYTFLSHQALRPFTKRNGLSVLVPMVPLVGQFKTTIWEGTRVVILPLETDLVNFVVLLPDNPKNINSLSKSINGKSLSQLFSTLYHQELEVFIPQLTIVSKKMDITPLLRDQGIKLAFSYNEANFKPASELQESIYIQNVTQDAYFSTSFVSLNSVAGMSADLSSNIRRKRDTSKIYFNHPYVFLITHRDTNLVLLAGKVENPIQVPT